MIFAVAMMFIDQTIVALAVPDLQRDLSCPRPARSGSSTATCWRSRRCSRSAASSPTFGHRRMVLIGVAGFASARRCAARRRPARRRDLDDRVPRPCRARSRRSCSRPRWRSSSRPSRRRARQGAGDLLLDHRRADPVGPIAGGYLTEWTWRAIFWINVPVAIIALILTLSRSRPRTHPGADRLRGAVLVSARHGPRRARPPAGRRLGLGQRRDLGLPGRRPGAARRVRPLRAARESRSSRCGCSPIAASRSTTPCCSCSRSLRPAVLLRQPVRAGRARRMRRRTRASSCSSSSAASPSPPSGAAGSSTARRAPVGRARAARSPPSASTCGER